MALGGRAGTVEGVPGRTVATAVGTVVQPTSSPASFCIIHILAQPKTKLFVVCCVCVGVPKSHFAGNLISREATVNTSWQ